MNEPNHDSSDQEPDRDVVDSLKTLKPRTPRLEWDAIKAARIAQDTTLVPATASPSSWSAYRQFVLVGCSGLAVGAAITYFAMNWFILRDLRTKVAQLEHATTTTTQSPPRKEPTSERSIAGSESILDLYAGLETPRLTVGAYRSRLGRLINAPSTPGEPKDTPESPPESPLESELDDSSQPNESTTSAPNGDDVTPLDKAMNRRQLLKELRHSI